LVSENVPPDLEAVDDEVRLLRILGDEIERLRNLRGLTQERLEEKSGISRSVIKELEGAIKRKRRRRKTLEELSIALGMPREYLDQIKNGHHTPEVHAPETSEDRVIQILEDMRAEFGDKFSALEERMGNIGADLLREHQNLTQRFDALYQRINLPGVPIGLDENRHVKDVPED
jgi:transcriptional regulator with XRE-family HTH domain